MTPELEPAAAQIALERPDGPSLSKYSTDAFLQACGASGPLRVSVECVGRVERHVFQQPYALIGHDPRADIRFAQGLVAKRHAYLQVLDGRILHLDVSGCSVGRRGGYPAHSWLGSGQVLQTGAAEIRVTGEVEAARPTGQSYRLEDLPPVSLEISGRRRLRAVYQAKLHLILIGSASECQIRLQDDEVSQYHCALVNTPNGLWAVDLLGRGGISLNGVVTRAARLDDGDHLQIGHYFIRPQSGSVPSPAALEGVDSPQDNLEPLELLQSALAESLVSRPEVGPTAELCQASASTAPEPSPTAELCQTSGNPTPEPLPAAYLQHFARAQQQLVEQFRLTMSGVIEAFREMHRDQMQLVRQELARVRQLTEELNAVKAKLARAAAPRAIAPSPPPQLPASPPARGPNGTPVASASPAPSEPTKPSPAETASGPKPKPATAGGPPRTVPAQPAKSYDEAQLQLMRRLAALQRERDGRLQKIMRFLGVNRKSI